MRVKPIGPASTAAKPVVQYALLIEVDISWDSSAMIPANRFGETT